MFRDFLATGVLFLRDPESWYCENTSSNFLGIIESKIQEGWD